MASAFWGGFAQTLGGNVQRRQQAKEQAREEQKSWLWKQEKALELEDRIRKQRVAKSETFEKDGQVWVQGVNADGEPVGEPRPASQWQIDAYKNGEKERSLRFQREEATIRSERLQGDRAEAGIGIDKANLDINRGELSLRQQAEKRAAQQAGYDSSYKEALTSEAQQRARALELQNKTAEEIGNLPLAERLRLGAVKGAKAPTADEANDFKVVADQLQTVVDAYNIEDPEVQELLEDIAAANEAGVDAAVQASMIVKAKAELERLSEQARTPDERRDLKALAAGIAAFREKKPRPK